MENASIFQTKDDDESSAADDSKGDEMMIVQGNTTKIGKGDSKKNGKINTAMGKGNTAKIGKDCTC